MILPFLLFITVTQVLLYYVFRKVKYASRLILSIILLGHLFVFPDFFKPEPPTEGINCGLPTMAALFAFWIFGTFTALVTHLVYYLNYRQNRSVMSH